MMQKIKCGTCSTISAAKFTRTFLGFRRFECPACRASHSLGLSRVTQGLYVAFAALLSYAVYTSGVQNGFLLLVIAYALFKDYEVKNSVKTAQFVTEE